MRTPTLSTRARLSLAIVAAGFVFGLTTNGQSLGDASTYVLMTDSLLNDGDLVYAPADYARAAALHFERVPQGLILTRHDWGYGYGKSFVYPAIAVPFYAAFGPRGFFILNGVLLAAIVLLGADALSRRIPWTRAIWVTAAVVGLSVTPIYVEWIDPFLTCSALAAAALAAYRREMPAATAALLVALAACRPPYAALAVAPLTLYALAGNWRRLARFVAAGAAVATFFLSVSIFAGEGWTPYGSQRFLYGSAFPYDGGDTAGSEEIGRPADDPVGERRWPDTREMAQMAKGFLIGRFAGVLVYFPGLIACVLWSRRCDREKLAWGGALLATCAAIFVAFPQNYFGGAHAIGNRLFTVLPIALVFVDFVEWRSWRALAIAALAVLVLPVLRAPVLLSHNPGQQMAWAPYRYLPLEWTHVTRMQPPFAYPGMAAFTSDQYYWERTGIWTRGGATAEFVFLRPPGRRPRVRLFSPLADVRIADGGVPVAWHPESMVVELANPVATTRDSFQEGKDPSVYVLSITTDSVFRPREHGGSNDNRYLGVFVEPIDRSRPQQDPASGVNRPQYWWDPPDS